MIQILVYKCEEQDTNNSFVKNVTATKFSHNSPNSLSSKFFKVFSPNYARKDINSLTTY